MAKEVYYQFPQTLRQARRCGARGGKATARKRRELQEGAARLDLQEPAASEVEPQVPRETTTAAIALLDAQFPWLRGAERRSANRPAPTGLRDEQPR